MRDDKRIVKTIKVLLLSLPLVLLLLPAVYATHPGTGSGIFTGSNGTPHVRTAGGNMIITHIVTFTITGASSGTCAGQERDVFHPGGTVTFQGMCTFIRMVGGKSGTAVERFSGTGSMTSFEGRFVIVKGTDGLTNLRGRGTFQGMPTGPDTSTGTYSMQFHFDPK